MSAFHARLLQVFRERHPSGTVATELLRTDAGMYVIRAEVRVDRKWILASGLATDTDLEKAEERAIERALTFAGFAEANVETPFDLAAPYTPMILEEPPPPPQARRNLPEISRNGSAYPQSPEIARNGNGSSSPEISRSSYSAPAESSRNGNGYVAPSEISRNGNGQLDLTRNSTPEKRQEPELDLEPLIDVADLIAQTDVHLKRIGWGAKEGKDYLQRTFGKSSRHHLDGIELQEFLTYLKAQPNHLVRQPTTQAPF
ncbi:MAG: hypothetical protein H7Y37_05295 [Anaerolineae bacterium]|nr:hypothetical protein [Gloeobacterales cyanobacterium ES-bin-313]